MDADDPRDTNYLISRSHAYYLQSFSCRWLEQPFIQYCLIPEMRWSRDTLVLISATSARHARTCDVNCDNPEGQLKYSLATSVILCVPIDHN